MDHRSGEVLLLLGGERSLLLQLHRSVSLHTTKAEKHHAMMGGALQMGPNREWLSSVERLASGRQYVRQDAAGRGRGG